MVARDATTRPAKIELDRTTELRVTWADGRQSVYPLAYLRRECPCATCREERAAASRNPLRVVPRAGAQVNMVVAESVELVGRYALRIRWLDGHQTGIYDFRLLRELTPTSGDQAQQAGS